MNSKHALAAAAIAAALAITAALARPGPAPAPGARAPAASSHRPPWSPASPTPPQPTSSPPTGIQLLPFRPTQLTAAARAASRFLATYASHRYDEPSNAYLARLTPLTSPRLLRQLQQAATDPNLLTQRRRTHETTVAHATAEAIRALGPTSIIFITAVTQHATTQPPGATAPALRRRLTRYAVTMTYQPRRNTPDSVGPTGAAGFPEDQSTDVPDLAETDWRAYALQPADVGDWGEGP